MKKNQYSIWILQKIHKIQKSIEDLAISPYLTVNQIILMQIATGDCVLTQNLAAR